MTSVKKERAVHQASSGSFNGGRVSESVTLSTTDATATVIYLIPCAQGECGSVRGLVTGMKSDGTAGYAGTFTAGFRRQSGGNVASLNSASITGIEDSAGTPAVSVNANALTQNFEIKVTGIAAETWYWEAHIEYMKVK